MSVKKNTAYNLLGAIIPIAASIATVPPFLHLIGAERFGVLSLFWLLLGYFGLFDLGLGRSLSQRLAELHDASPAVRSEAFWSALVVSAALGVATMLLLMLVSSWALSLVKFDTPYIAAEVREAIPLFAATLPVSLVSGIFSGALSGRERFGITNLVESVANITSVILPLAVAWWFGPRLILLLGSVLAVRAMAMLVLLTACRSAVPVVAFSRLRREVIRPLLGYGGWVTVESIVGSALQMWDRFAIGAVLGAAAVSVYVIPSNVILRLIVIPAAFTRALFPRLVRGTHGDAGRLMSDGVRALSLLLTPATIGLCALVGPLLTLWLGSRLAVQSAPVAAIILPAVFANSMAQMFLNFLQARRRADVVAKLHLIEILPYAGLLYFLMHGWGIQGAALAWAIRTSLDAVLLGWLAQVRWQDVRGVTGQFGLTVASAALALLVPFDMPVFWVGQSLLLVLGCLWCLADAPPQIVDLGRSQLARLRVRLNI